MPTVEDIVKHIEKTCHGKRLVIFVCGFGGAGKTTICRNLAAQIKCPAIVFETDWFARYATVERRERIKSALAFQDEQMIEREENPKNWYDWDLLGSSLQILKETGHLEIRNGWCQQTGDKVLNIDLHLPDPADSDSVIICDGIYLLHDEVKDKADLIVLLDTSIDTCLERTARRDNHRSSKEYLEYKAALVEQYDKPYFNLYSRNAHMVLSRTD